MHVTLHLFTVRVKKCRKGTHPSYPLTGYLRMHNAYNKECILIVDCISNDDCKKEKDLTVCMMGSTGERSCVRPSMTTCLLGTCESGQICVGSNRCKNGKKTDLLLNIICFV